MMITREQAMEIAQDAMENAGYDITEYAGYYPIWRDDEDPENNWAVAINKEMFDGDSYFAVYTSSNYDEGCWDYTDNLDINELVDVLMRFVEGIEKEMMQ